jgi:hypothetical protein
LRFSFLCVFVKAPQDLLWWENIKNNGEFFL